MRRSRIIVAFFIFSLVVLIDNNDDEDRVLLPRLVISIHSDIDQVNIAINYESIDISHYGIKISNDTWYYSVEGSALDMEEGVAIIPVNSSLIVGEEYVVRLIDIKTNKIVWEEEVTCEDHFQIS